MKHLQAYTCYLKHLHTNKTFIWTGLPAPPVDLLHKPCGERITARVVCSHCGEDLDVHDTEPVVGRGLIMHRGNRT